MKYTVPKIIKEKQAKKESREKFWKVFLIEGGLFLLTSLLAIVSAFELNRLAQSKKFYLPATPLQSFLFALLFVVFFVLIFVTYKKAGKLKPAIYKGFFLIISFWGIMAILNLFLPVFVAVLVAGILIALWLERQVVWMHNGLMSLGLAGIASFFGLGFTPSVAVAFLLISSVYNFIATYKTKHSALIEKEMMENKIVLGFIIPKDLKRFKDKLKELKPNGNFMILGGGSVVFPSLLAVSVIPSGLLKALIIVLFSFFGCLLGHYIFTKEPKGKAEPTPTLQPITLFSIIGYLITMLLPS